MRPSAHSFPVPAPWLSRPPDDCSSYIAHSRPLTSDVLSPRRLSRFGKLHPSDLHRPLPIACDPGDIPVLIYPSPATYALTQCAHSRTGTPRGGLQKR